MREQPEARLHPPSQVSGLRSDPTSLACPHSSEGHLKTNGLHQPMSCAQRPHGTKHQVVDLAVDGTGRGDLVHGGSLLASPSSKFLDKYTSNFSFFKAELFSVHRQSPPAPGA